MGDEFRALLLDNIWHATSITSFEAILADQVVRSAPSVTRHKNSFCQYLGRVSLFDFREAPHRDSELEVGNWTSFLSAPPCRTSVWLRVDQARLEVPTAADLLDEWETHRQTLNSGQPGKRIIPHLETGHVGDLDIDLIADAVLIDGDTGKFEIIALDGFAIERARAFSRRAFATPDDSFAAALIAAQQKRMS